jgi:L-ribulose-5-phosphate 3-epimerase
MKTPFAINTYSYLYGFQAADCMSYLWKRFGCHNFELMVFPGHCWPAELDRAARQRIRMDASSRGWRIHTLNLPNLDINIAAADPQMRELSVDRIENTLRLAADIGASCVLIGPGKPNPLFSMPFERLQDHFFSALDRVLPLARELGITLAVENLPIAFLPRAADLMEALARYGDRTVEIVYDIANAYFHGEDPCEGLKFAESRVRRIHVSDTTRQVYRHNPIGEGDVPWCGLAKVLHGIGGPVTTFLEIISVTPDEDIERSADRLVALDWPPAVDAVQPS